MRIICIILVLCSTVFAADLQPGAWGEAKGGVRSRILATQKTYRAGEPIPMKLEIENVGNAVKEIVLPALPHFGTLSVKDEKGKMVVAT